MIRTQFSYNTTSAGFDDKENGYHGDALSQTFYFAVCGADF